MVVVSTAHLRVCRASHYLSLRSLARLSSASWSLAPVDFTQSDPDIVDKYSTTIYGDNKWKTRIEGFIYTTKKSIIQNASEADHDIVYVRGQTLFGKDPSMQWRFVLNPDEMVFENSDVYERYDKPPSIVATGYFELDLDAIGRGEFPFYVTNRDIYTDVWHPLKFICFDLNTRMPLELAKLGQYTRDIPKRIHGTIHGTIMDIPMNTDIKLNVTSLFFDEPPAEILNEIEVNALSNDRNAKRAKGKQPIRTFSDNIKMNDDNKGGNSMAGIEDLSSFDPEGITHSEIQDNTLITGLFSPSLNALEDTFVQTDLDATPAPENINAETSSTKDNDGFQTSNFLTHSPDNDASNNIANPAPLSHSFNTQFVNITQSQFSNQALPPGPSHADRNYAQQGLRARPMTSTSVSARPSTATSSYGQSSANVHGGYSGSSTNYQFNLSNGSLGDNVNANAANHFQGQNTNLNNGINNFGEGGINGRYNNSYDGY